MEGAFEIDDRLSTQTILFIVVMVMRLVIIFQQPWTGSMNMLVPDHTD